ncbi:transposase family protein [Streptomyces sp. NPDC096153]|uniref:transposase family protein n=1 Tax=Streptomyces sp. NPDC096153 TaxID=3155548 RepID=UPI0033259007
MPRSGRPPRRRRPGRGRSPRPQYGRVTRRPAARHPDPAGRRELGIYRVCGSGGLGRLLPHLAGVVVESIERAAGVVTFRTRSCSGSARCPGCGIPSWRVHGRYVRRLADAPLGGASVVIELGCVSSRDQSAGFALAAGSGPVDLLA